MLAFPAARADASSEDYVVIGWSRFMRVAFRIHLNRPSEVTLRIAC